jgi:chromosome segregation protein
VQSIWQLQEYEEVSQRFEELSHQMQDLENTVSQLKDAMKSIDQETRKLFMTTFDQVNTELQELFPKYLMVVKRV